LTPIALFILALGLGSDAFAAAVAKGASTHHPRLRDRFGTALYFGGAEAIMVSIGFLIGVGFHDAIKDIDHWVAFVLLGIIGGKMLWEGFQGVDEEDAHPKKRATPMIMVVTAIGTSIDSAVVGVTLALLGVSILLAAPMIGATSFTMSLIGVYIGHRVGPLLGKRAEIIGGLVLILIGTKILSDHLSGAV
jgi:putative Mn2+ efflux pump MntP